MTLFNTMCISLVFCWIWFFSACQGLIWSPELTNGSTIYACTGDDVKLPWGYTLDSYENSIADVEWYFTPIYSHSPNCSNRWSQWINRDNPHSERRDEEKMTSQEMTQFCPGGHVRDVQCATRQGYPVSDGEEGLVCNLLQGFQCNDDVVAPATCNDYQIRYRCQCQATGNDQVLMATLGSDGQFVRSLSTSQNATLYTKTEAGVTLHDVSSMDNGMYTVMINVLESQYSSFTSYRDYIHYVLLNVVDSADLPPNHSCLSASSIPTSFTSSSVFPHNVTLPRQQDHMTTPGVPIG